MIAFTVDCITDWGWYSVLDDNILVVCIVDLHQKHGVLYLTSRHYKSIPCVVNPFWLLRSANSVQHNSAAIEWSSNAGYPWLIFLLMGGTFGLQHKHIVCQERALSFIFQYERYAILNSTSFTFSFWKQIVEHCDGLQDFRTSFILMFQSKPLILYSLHFPLLNSQNLTYIYKTFAFFAHTTWSMFTNSGNRFHWCETDDGAT